MLIGRLDLAPTNRSYSRVLRSAHRAFGIFTCLVETSLMERMLAEEMNGGKLQRTTTRLAASSLDNKGVRVELLKFLLLAFGLACIARDQSAILGQEFSKLRKRQSHILQNDKAHL